VLFASISARWIVVAYERALRRTSFKVQTVKAGEKFAPMPLKHWQNLTILVCAEAVKPGTEFVRS
jgi:hypothetical protein